MAAGTTNITLTKQYIQDSPGKPIGIILPIEEYRALTQAQANTVDQNSQPARVTLYGVLRHLGGAIAPTEILDETRRELWSTWNRGDTP
jgi:hypothetical protein